MTALALHFAALRSDKRGRSTLMSGITAIPVSGISAVSQRLLPAGFVTVAATSILYFYSELPVGCIMTFGSNSALPSVTVSGFLALPGPCSVKFTNITQSTSVDGGIDITAIHD